MQRRSMVMGALALGACQSGGAPLNGKLQATPALYEDFDIYSFEVKDVARTDLGGTVIYDEVIPFDAGSHTPPNGGNGATGSGGRIKGAVQSRVVRSNNTGNLIFAYRFRDMQFFPGTGPQNKGSSLVNVEIVSLRGFPQSAFPIELYELSLTQSLGAELLGLRYTGSGSFEANTFLTEPEGTSFTEILTKATKYKTGKYLSFEVDARGNGGGQYRVEPPRIAVPA